MPRSKEPKIPDAILDQLLAGADAKSAFEANGLLRCAEEGAGRTGAGRQHTFPYGDVILGHPCSPVNPTPPRSRDLAASPDVPCRRWSEAAKAPLNCPGWTLTLFSFQNGR